MPLIFPTTTNPDDPLATVYEPTETYYGIELLREVYLYLYAEHLPETNYPKSDIRDKCRQAGKEIEKILEKFDDAFAEYSKKGEWL